MSSTQLFRRHIFIPSGIDIFWLTLVIVQFLLALFLSWVVLAQMNFAYGLWHDHGGLGENITVYGPENRYKKDFVLTSRQERLRLFREIVTAIHRDGVGLEEITYHYPNGNSVDRLLREPEVVHLQDVSHVVSFVHSLGYVLCFVFALMLMWAYRQSLKVQKLWQYHVMGFTILLLGIGLVLLIGAEAVFNQLHIWVFPDNHQWFFYYQDSLMSTMMKAPVMFAYIACLMLFISLLIHFVLAYGMQLLLKYKR